MLQQILFYRELGLPLEEIARIMKDPSFDPLAALQSHRAAVAVYVQEQKGQQKS